MSSHHCIQCRIHGRVQGVWFRDSTRSEAQRLGLSGYARNLPDGTVEVLACGAAGQVVALKQWLQHGPSAARVDQLICSEIAPGKVPTQYNHDFTIE